jgi:hypothetical protein
MTRIAILQSAYIPWKGYFDIIASVDMFVVYDDVQYRKNHWHNRNLIKTQHGPKWLTVPVLTKNRRPSRPSSSLRYLAPGRSCTGGPSNKIRPIRLLFDLRCRGGTTLRRRRVADSAVGGERIVPPRPLPDTWVSKRPLCVQVIYRPEVARPKGSSGQLAT